MGTLFVDKLDPQSGTSLEIGSSGDTITIPSGCTITNNGTQTGFGGTNTPFFNVLLTSAPNINHATTTKINFDTVKTESSTGIYDTSNSKFTVPSGQAGNYEITLKVRLIDTDNNMMRTDFYIYKNGSSLGQFGGLTTGTDQDLRGIDSCCSIILDLAVGDYIEAYTYVETSDSGTVILYGSSGYETYLSGFKLVE